MLIQLFWLQPLRVHEVHNPAGAELKVENVRLEYTLANKNDHVHVDHVYTFNCHSTVTLLSRDVSLFDTLFSSTVAYIHR